MRDYKDLSIDEIDTALNHIDAGSSRDEWYKMLCAVKAELSDAGRDIAMAWSQKSDKFNQRDFDFTWRKINVYGKTKIGTLIAEAQKNGFEFGSQRVTITADEIERRENARKIAMEKQQKRERLASEFSARVSAQALIWWEKYTDAPDDHPYLVRKNIKPHTAKFGNWRKYGYKLETIETYSNALIIPIYNVNGLYGLQGITPTKHLQANGKYTDKHYMFGLGKSGLFTYFGEPKKRIIICEGWATGASIYEATGDFVMVAFDCGQLEDKAKIAREKWPKLQIIIAADNDQFTHKNPGITMAEKLSKEIPDCSYVYPEFSDLSNKPTDFNDLHVMSGITAVSEIFTPKIENDVPSVSEKPFFCLGYGDDKYYFYSRERKQVVTRTAAGINESALLELAPKSYWVSNFPDKQDKYQKSDAINYLLRSCHRKGLYDPLRHVRGRGAWIDQERLIFHFGDHLNVDGNRVEIEDIDSRYVYECAPELAAPLNKALSDKEGEEILRVASMFNWKQSSSALLLCGYIALAPLCGVLKWRPHIWVTGGAGSGKSTILSRFVNVLLGSIPVYAQGNSTEAGIRQTLKSDALPVVFDESESNNQSEQMRIQNLLAMIRQSSSDSAAKTYKGTSGGRSMSFYIRSMFCLASIQASIQHQADMERITKLELKQKGGNNNGDEWTKLSNSLYDVIERDDSLPLRLFKRSIDLFPVIKANIEIFSNVAANMPQFGSQRKGDQYGTLLAGCWSLLSDKQITPEQAKDFINRYDWSEYQEGTEIEESEKALGFLLERKIRTEKGGEYSLYELIKKATTPDGGGLFAFEHESKATIERYGMILHDGLLYISNTSDNAAALFKNSVYESGWKDQLLRADGVTRHKTTKRFNGKPSRCLEVNLIEIGVL